MDPNACWEKMVEASEENDYETAHEYATYMQKWICSGGFTPDNYDPELLNQCLDCVFA